MRLDKNEKNTFILVFYCVYNKIPLLITPQFARYQKTYHVVLTFADETHSTCRRGPEVHSSQRTRLQRECRSHNRW
jgi:hypothetical protein